MAQDIMRRVVGLKWVLFFLIPVLFLAVLYLSFQKSSSGKNSASSPPSQVVPSFPVGKSEAFLKRDVQTFDNRRIPRSVVNALKEANQNRRKLSPSKRKEGWKRGGLLDQFYPFQYGAKMEVSTPGMKIEIIPEGSGPGDPEIFAGIILYRQTEKGVDVMRIPGDDRTEEVLFIHDPAALRDFQYRVELPDSVKTIRKVDGFWEFRDGSGTARIRLHPVFAEDATGKELPANLDLQGLQLVSKEEDGSSIYAMAGELVLTVSVSDEDATYPILIDPVWSSTSSLAVERYRHSATLLWNAKVLVTGGYTAALSNETSVCELYDPATGTWSLTGSLGTARRGHPATLLPNGKVLVVGGGHGRNSRNGTLFL